MRKSVDYGSDEMINDIIRNALSEDIGNGDITTSAVVPKGHRTSAALVAKSDFLLAGMAFAERTFALVDSGIRFKVKKQDGSKVRIGIPLAEIRGEAASLLKAERVALNLLQRCSGIATLTGRFVERVRGLPVRILDTRKTTPGLRICEKYAVRVGGGHNHRFGLFDGVLVKDNHILIAGGVKNAVRSVQRHAHHLAKIEVEVGSIREVRDAIAAGVDVIMLDNMSPVKMKQAVRIVREADADILIEASGNISLENVRAVAITGVDFISVGAITHAAASADISMKFRSNPAA